MDNLLDIILPVAIFVSRSSLLRIAGRKKIITVVVAKNANTVMTLQTQTKLRYGVEEDIHLCYSKLTIIDFFNPTNSTKTEKIFFFRFSKICRCSSSKPTTNIRHFHFVDPGSWLVFLSETGCCCSVIVVYYVDH